MWVFPWLFWFWFGLVLIAGFDGLCWIEFVVLFDCGLAGYVGWWLRLLISYAVSLLVVMGVYAAFGCWFVVVLAVAVWVSLLLRWFGLVNSVGLLVF